MKRLFVCSKADDCTTLECGCHWPHEPDATYLCEAEMDCGEHGKVRCIRHRHPLEVVILKKIKSLRNSQAAVYYCGYNWFEYETTIKTLWRVLKEWRKA